MFYLRLFDPAAVQTTSTDNEGNTLKPEIKEYYEKKLLDNARANLVHDQFGNKYTIPQGHGHTIEWRKITPFAKAMESLTEGVTPDGSTLNVEAITSELAQYGDYVRFSDRLDLEAIDPIVNETCSEQGAQAGLTLNAVTRDELTKAQTVQYAGGEEDREDLTASSTLKVAEIFKAVATLRAANAPTFDGDYVAIIHPWVANDLMMDVSTSGSHVWMEVNKYANPQAIFAGEIGKLGGCRFVSSTEAKIWNSADDDCPAADEGYYSVFQTLVLGKGAYGVTELSGAGLEYIVKPLGYGDDPLNQRSSAGWKAMKAAKILDDTRMVSIESCSATQPQAPAN